MAVWETERQGERESDGCIGNRKRERESDGCIGNRERERERE